MVKYLIVLPYRITQFEEKDKIFDPLNLQYEKKHKFRSQKKQSMYFTGKQKNDKPLGIGNDNVQFQTLDKISFSPLKYFSNNLGDQKNHSLHNKGEDLSPWEISSEEEHHNLKIININQDMNDTPIIKSQGYSPYGSEIAIDTSSISLNQNPNNAHNKWKTMKGKNIFSSLDLKASCIKVSPSDNELNKLFVQGKSKTRQSVSSAKKRMRKAIAFKNHNKANNILQDISIDNYQDNLQLKLSCTQLNKPVMERSLTERERGSNQFNESQNSVRYIRRKRNPNSIIHCSLDFNKKSNKEEKRENNRSKINSQKQFNSLKLFNLFHIADELRKSLNNSNISRSQRQNREMYETPQKSSTIDNINELRSTSRVEKNGLSKLNCEMDDKTSGNYIQFNYHPQYFFLFQIDCLSSSRVSISKRTQLKKKDHKSIEPKHSQEKVLPNRAIFPNFPKYPLKAMNQEMQQNILNKSQETLNGDDNAIQSNSHNIHHIYHLSKRRNQSHNQEQQTKIINKPLPTDNLYNFVSQTKHGYSITSSNWQTNQQLQGNTKSDNSKQLQSTEHKGAFQYSPQLFKSNTPNIHVRTNKPNPTPRIDQQESPPNPHIYNLKQSIQNLQDNYNFQSIIQHLNINCKNTRLYPRFYNTSQT